MIFFYLIFLFAGSTDQNFSVDNSNSLYKNDGNFGKLLTKPDLDFVKEKIRKIKFSLDLRAVECRQIGGHLHVLKKTEKSKPWEQILYPY